MSDVPGFIPQPMAVLAAQVASLIQALKMQGIDVSQAVIEGKSLPAAIQQQAQRVMQGAIGQANGIAGLDSQGNLVVNGKTILKVDALGNVTIVAPGSLTFAPGVLPTTDPGNSLQAWNNGGFLMLSQGNGT